MIGGSALIALTALAAGQSLSGDGSTLIPASEPAIVAGGKACIGATVDPAGQDGRLAGWQSNEPLAAGTHAKGQIVSRDNVLLIVKPGADGGCVVQARGDATFDKAKLFTDLSQMAGVPIDGTKATVSLPNGEIMIVQVGGDKGANMIQLVIANSKHITHPQGN